MFIIKNGEVLKTLPNGAMVHHCFEIETNTIIVDGQEITQTLKFNAETGELDIIDSISRAVVIPPTVEEELAEVKEQNLILMDAMATLYEEIQTLKGV